MRLLLLALLFSLAGLAFAEIPAAPEDLVRAETRIDPAQPTPPWNGILLRLQEKETIYARFIENRYLPFKKIPQVFTGEIRLTREHGLSLHYRTPEERTLVVDAQGVMAKDRDGRTREMPSDARALAATQALLHVMQFDLKALSEQFQVHAAGDEALWHFAFEPKDEAVAKTLSRLVVTGEKDAVKRIVMRRSALQSVEILVPEVLDGVTFTPEEVKSHFR